MKNFENQLKEISTLREKKGQEKETLRRINELLREAEEAGDWKTVATLYMESHLVWQHTAMAELSKAEGKRDIESINLGVQKMMEFAEKAKDVILEHNIAEMMGDAYRNLGRASTYYNKHEKAKEFYEEAISKYQEGRAHRKLEMKAFISESLLRLGQTEEGLKLAKDTYNEFFQSDLGQKLKKDDYFVWAVWMSGIPPRTLDALMETGAEYDKEEMEKWLKEAKKELKNPSGEVEWGDEKFQFRVDQIDYSLEKLALTVLLILASAAVVIL